MPLDVELLKTERESLRESLRTLETEQRKLEAELKSLRQREVQTKREIDALATLIELHDKSEPRASEG